MPQQIPPIYFLRHGQTDWNAEQRFQGRRDIPLNNLGERQAFANGQRLAQLLPDPSNTHLYCSPLTRTRQTLALMLKGANWDQLDWAQSVIFDDRLIELTFGDWEGWTLTDIQQREPALYAQREENKWNACPPSGESYAMLAQRVGTWLKDLTKPTVVVAHGGVLRALHYHLETMEPQKAASLPIFQDKIFVWDGQQNAWM